MSGLGLLTANPWLTSASVLVVPILVTLLWRKGEVPILLFAVGFQWIQVTTKVFHADLLKVKVAAISASESVDVALWLSLVGLLVIAVGMRVGLLYLRNGPASDVKGEARAFSVDRVFVAYVAAAIIALALTSVAWATPRLTQLLLSLAELKWVFFFILACIVLADGRKPWYLVLAILYEILVGLGYFSGFKTPLFFTGLALVAVMRRLTWRSAAGMAVFMGGLILAGSTWMNLRADYRAYVNRGTGQQVVEVSFLERWQYLGRLIVDLQPAALLHGVEPLAERLSYVDYFALAVERVPAVQGYERGALWLSSVRNTIVPRILYPAKPVLPSDSELTMRYTGLHLPSGPEGTSISLGYMAESYVDFGPAGMFLPVFLVGLLWGLIYSFFASRAASPLLTNAFAAVVLIHASLFEIAAVKLLAGVLVKFIILALVLEFGVKGLERWLMAKPIPCTRDRQLPAQG